MIELNDKLIELLRSALIAIDGLWFLEVEEALGFERAFKIDLNVWKRYGTLIIKRIKKILHIETTDLESFLLVLKIICTIDGTKFQIKEKSEHRIILKITYCPWWENLKRSKRDQLVRCDQVDDAIFPVWAKYFNSKIKFNLTKAIPNGDADCEWTILLEE
ncbi:MAG: DUF6125 family protein [Candidatus Helarchaeota archaeon]